MKLLITFYILICLSPNSFAQTYNLSDFFQYDANLAQKTDAIFSTLNDTAIVGQLFVQAAGQYGKPDHQIEYLIKHHYIGGILMLNGSKDSFKQKINHFNTINRGLPLIISADAEPSLINQKISNTTPVKQANKMLNRQEVRKYAKIICDELKTMGINYNYAPVVDMSPNQIISFRSFGLNPDTAKVWANIFIEETQKNGIIATAKHFPGHGYVSGDTHKKLVYIDGEMKEVKNYKPLIKNGVISIMVAHIAVKNNAKYNTNGLPSSCSRKIVTNLLKNELNFKGIVITDAMNMGGVASIENCELTALKAGCDMILMPVDTEKAVLSVLSEIKKNNEFKQQVYASSKKIIRAKICLGIL
jgi:beta-N-acetylhexosaminidase